LAGNLPCHIQAFSADVHDLKSPPVLGELGLLLAGVEGMYEDAMGTEVRADTNGEHGTDDVVKLLAELDGLKLALASRDTIGQAKGILMERYRLSADEAFEQLRVASQTGNCKLIDLARQLTETGEWPPG
jgi:hypothetical protein